MTPARWACAAAACALSACTHQERHDATATQSAHVEEHATEQQDTRAEAGPVDIRTEIDEYAPRESDGSAEKGLAPLPSPAPSAAAPVLVAAGSTPASSRPVPVLVKRTVITEHRAPVVATTRATQAVETHADTAAALVTHSEAKTTAGPGWKLYALVFALGLVALWLGVRWLRTVLP